MLSEELYGRISSLGQRAHIAWGPQAEMIKAAEECSELSVQICKVVGGSPTTRENVVDEIADVLLMTMRLRDRYGYAEVDERITFKLNRLETALYKHSMASSTPPALL
jgi:NTP pyrophosphatase (non-canonical NTP hydrolase)